MNRRATRALLAMTLGLVAVGGGAAATAQAATCTSPVVVYHKVLKTAAGQSVGYVDLEYSTACHSARAHVHSIYVSHPGATHGAGAAIKSNTGQGNKYCTVGEGAQDCRTGWLYDLNPNTAYASGWIDMYPISYELVEGRTSSY